ncbi:transposase [Phocaeicola dorei]|uniref:IS66 family transposase n=1 Tax=Phocaeicola dorei TaxID=357276 RepID=UPI0039B4ABEA
MSAYESFLEWDLSFLHDGDFLIDNNWAERSIRQLTILRNSSLHYASDVGIKMVVIYYSVIGTVRFHGISF